MDALEPREIEFRLHGRHADDHGRVPARVFANKLVQLVAALEAADRSINGQPAHDYILAKMHMSQPTALLKEVPLGDINRDSTSAIPIFGDAVDAILIQDSRTAALAPVVRVVGRLTAGATKKFGFAEVRYGNNLVRIDEFLATRAAGMRQKKQGPWYEGASFGSFDGTLKVVDLRGSLPQFQLILTAGQKAIDCTCNQQDIESLGEALNKRVRVYGRAIYSSQHPLPLKVEVSRIEAIRENGDLSRWRGSFRQFELNGWGYEL